MNLHSLQPCPATNSQAKIISPLLILGAAALLLSSCGEAPKAMVMPPASVQIARVSVEPFKEKSNYVGTLKSRKSITLLPNIEGHVTDIKATSGQFVPAGATIMRIDSRMQTAQTDAYGAAADSVNSDLATARATLSSMQSTLKSRQANLEYTKMQHARYQQLSLEGAVSQSEADNWKNSYTAAQADKEVAQQQIEAQKMTVQKMERSHQQAVANYRAQKDQLSYYEITAPFAGVVGDIPVKVGDHVTSSTQLTTLTENHPLEVYISLPAEKAVDVRQGMHIALTSTDGRQYGDSTVTFISPTVDPNSQTVLIKSLFQNAKSELRADQTITAQVVWHVHDGISIPTKAVTQAAGKYFVFVAQETPEKKLVAKQAEIEVYEIDGDKYQVKSGLKPGDRIVTTGIQRLGDGAPIEQKSDLAGKPDAANSH
jgi:RND family efflux transporter MFP subunit